MAPGLLLAQKGSEGGTPEQESFDVDGIKVILSPADNEIVSIIVGLEGGFADGMTNNPALAEFTAGLIASSGSEEVSKSELRSFLSKSSTRLDGGADKLGMRFAMTSTRARFDEAWGVLSSMMRSPLVDNVEFRNRLQRSIANVKQTWSDPDSYSFRIADSLLRIGNPVMARYPYEADYQAITPDAISLFYKGMQERSRLLVIVVGNVTREEITGKLKDFSSWPKGDYSPTKIPSLVPSSKPTVTVLDWPASPTTYVYAAFQGPNWTDEGSWPLAVGMSYLRTELFKEIRTKRNLSYAPSAFSTSSHGRGMAMLGVSTVWPDSSIKIMYAELEKMKKGDFSEKDLEDAKQVYITHYYMQEMTNAAKANRFYYNERYAGDWRRADSFDDIRSVNKDDVVDAFQQYAKNLQVGIVGNAASVTQSAFMYADGVTAK